MENRNINTETAAIDKFIDDQMEICKEIELVTLNLCKYINDEEYDKATDLMKQREHLLNKAVLLKEKIYYFKTNIQNRQKLNSVFAPVFEELKSSNEMLSKVLASQKDKVGELIKKAMMQKAIASYK